MNTHSSEENLLRLYLLGATTFEEDEEIERRLDDISLKEELREAEEDLIDDYARGVLPGDQRMLFEMNFLVRPERQQKVSIAQAAVRYAQSQPRSVPGTPASPADKPEVSAGGWLRGMFRPAWAIPIFALLLVGVGAMLWRSGGDRSDIGLAIKAMNQAYRARRPLEVRISGLDYAIYPKTLGGEERPIEAPAIDRAERILLDEMAERPSPAAQHALGQVYLTQKKFKEAQDLFVAALQAEPGNARLLSDLGAALFERWLRERGPGQPAATEELRSQSLEYFTKALTLDARLLDARFNRALLYQYSGQTESARAEWQLYLKEDSDSPWSKEAEINLRSLK